MNWQKLLAGGQRNQFAWSTVNRQVNRPAADAAIFDQILFALRSIYFKADVSPQCGQTTSAETTGSIGMFNFDFVVQPASLADPTISKVLIKSCPIFWRRLHRVCESAVAEHVARHSAKWSQHSYQFGHVRLLSAGAPTGELRNRRWC